MIFIDHVPFVALDDIHSVAKSTSCGTGDAYHSVRQRHTSQIVKVTKDPKSIVTREVLTEKWTDWIDY